MVSMARERVTWVPVLAAAVICGASPAWSNIALRFVATHVHAPAAALVVAHAAADGGNLKLQVVRVVYGSVPLEIVPEHPGWFNPQLRDGAQYLVLLADHDAYPGPVTDDGIQAIGCGVINAMEVVNGLVADPGLYDVKFMGTKKVLTLEAVERDLAKVHKRRPGV
jgi:hypothetical protein